MNDQEIIRRLGELAAKSRKAGHASDTRRMLVLGLLTKFAFDGDWVG